RQIAMRQPHVLRTAASRETSRLDRERASPAAETVGLHTVGGQAADVLRSIVEGDHVGLGVQPAQGLDEVLAIGLNAAGLRIEAGDEDQSLTIAIAAGLLRPCGQPASGSRRYKPPF